MCYTKHLNPDFTRIHSKVRAGRPRAPGGPPRPWCCIISTSQTRPRKIQQPHRLSVAGLPCTLRVPPSLAHWHTQPALQLVTHRMLTHHTAGSARGQNSVPSKEPARPLALGAAESPLLGAGQGNRGR